MVKIIRATQNDAALLTALAQTTFWESHGHSGPETAIRNYIADHYNETELKKELSDPANLFHFIYHADKPVGFSKLIFDHPFEGCPVSPVTKLERIYLLQEVLGLKLGKQLMDFNIDLAKKQDQSGIWLFVWKGNERAFRFYQHAGFEIVGEYDFKISETHYNPNYRMLLRF